MLALCACTASNLASVSRHGRILHKLAHLPFFHCLHYIEDRTPCQGQAWLAGVACSKLLPRWLSQQHSLPRSARPNRTRRWSPLRFCGTFPAKLTAEHRPCTPLIQACRVCVFVACPLRGSLMVARPLRFAWSRVRGSVSRRTDSASRRRAAPSWAPAPCASLQTVPARSFRLSSAVRTALPKQTKTSSA